MADFEKAFQWMLPHEGGYCNDPDDKGGATNAGITHGTLERWNRSFPDHAFPESVLELTLDQVRTIYLTWYWLRGFEKITSQRVATKVFDFGVNAGPARSVRLAQETLARLGFRIHADGMLGPMTISALNMAEERSFLNGFVVRLEDYYRQLVFNDPSQNKFLHGWLNRARMLPEAS